MAIPVKKMKFIDRFVGVPACACLTLWKRLFRRSPDINKLSINKILFVELSEMGSMVAVAPAIHDFKQMNPQSKLFFLTFKQNRFALETLKIIPQDQIVTIDSSSLFKLVITLVMALKTLRQHKLDAVIDLELFSRVSAILSFCVRAQLTIGFDRLAMEGLYRGHLMTHPVGYNPYVHISANFASLMHILTKKAPLQKGLLKVDIARATPPVPAPPVNRAIQSDLWTKLHMLCPQLSSDSRIVIINPNAGSLLPIRAWPLDRYIRVTQQLLDDNDKMVVLIMGTDEASADAKAIKHAVNSTRLIDFTGQTKFEDIIPLFSLSDLLITNDSGPAHFASLTKIAIIVFFGPETPLLYGPISERCRCFFANLHCSPCLSAFNHRTTHCTDNLCLKAISEEAVMLQAKQFIDNAKPPARPTLSN